MKRVKSIISLIIITIFLGVLFTGCGNSEKQASSAQTKKPEKIRIGYQPGINHALLIVAKQQGWFDDEFKKDGIKVEFEQFTSGPPMIESFAGNKLDFGQVGDQPAIQARANNIDIKAIAAYSAGYKSDGLIVPNGSDIKSPKDLKGKKVGITVGSTGHRLLYLYLNSVGLTPKDIKEVNLQPADIKTAIATKNIDAAVTWEPWLSTVEYEGIGHQIADATGLKFGVNNVIVTSSFAKQYPDIVKRVLKIYQRAEKFIKDNPDKTVDLVAKDINMKREILAKAFPKVGYDIRLTNEVVSSIKDTYKILRDNNTIKKDVNIDQLIDDSYLKSIGEQ